MTLLYEFREELQEEGDDEQSDVHSVDIGIGGHYHLVVSQRVESVLNVERSLKEVELLVFVHHLFCQSERVERFSSQREYSLSVYVAAFGNASAGRVTLGDEYRAFLLPFVFHVAVVYAAVAQLPVVQVCLLCTFPCEFSDSGHSLSFLFALLYLLQHHVGHFLVFVQEVVHFGFYEVAHVFVYAHTTSRGHGERTELNLRLTFKHRFLHVDGDGRHETVTNVGVFEVFAEEFLYCLGNMLLERTLVSTALCGVLSVDKRMIFLAILVGMGECNLDVLSLEMDDGIESVARHGVVEQVLESVSAENASPAPCSGKCSYGAWSL